MLFTLIKGTDFRRFVDFASPAFFDVMPARTLWDQGLSLVQGYRDRDRLDRAVAHRKDALARVGLGPQVVDGSRGTPLVDANETERRSIGAAVLELYFHQILDADGDTLLNLGRKRLQVDGQPEWCPGPGVVSWPEDFRKTIEGMYRAFYEEGAGSLADALEPVGLAPCVDIFERHFGAGDQRAVQFKSEAFVSAFHEVFVRCKEQKIRLHGGFLPLGIYLATLYDALEAVQVPLDVRTAFERAASASS